MNARKEVLDVNIEYVILEYMRIGILHDTTPLYKAIHIVIWSIYELKHQRYRLLDILQSHIRGYDMPFAVIVFFIDVKFLIVLVSVRFGINIIVKDAAVDRIESYAFRFGMVLLHLIQNIK